MSCSVTASLVVELVYIKAAIQALSQLRYVYSRLCCIIRLVTRYPSLIHSIETPANTS